MRRVTHVADALPNCASPTPGESGEARGRVAASRPMWLPLDAYFSDRLWLAALAAAPKEGFVLSIRWIGCFRDSSGSQPTERIRVSYGSE